MANATKTARAKSYEEKCNGSDAICRQPPTEAAITSLEASYLQSYQTASPVRQQQCLLEAECTAKRLTLVSGTVHDLKPQHNKLRAGTHRRWCILTFVRLHPRSPAGTLVHLSHPRPHPFIVLGSIETALSVDFLKSHAECLLGGA